MARHLPLRSEQPLDDATVIVRAGVMEPGSVRRAASRSFVNYAVHGISVEAVIDCTIAEACRSPPDPLPNPADLLAGSVMGRGAPMTDPVFDIAVDFMDMTDAGLLVAIADDVRAGVHPTVGDHVIVGDDDADPRVARVVAIDEEGHLDLEVLPGPVDAHRDLLPTR